MTDPGLDNPEGNQSESSDFNLLTNDAPPHIARLDALFDQLDIAPDAGKEIKFALYGFKADMQNSMTEEMLKGMLNKHLTNLSTTTNSALKEQLRQIQVRVLNLGAIIPQEFIVNTIQPYSTDQVPEFTPIGLNNDQLDKIIELVMGTTFDNPLKLDELTAGFENNPIMLRQLHNILIPPTVKVLEGDIKGVIEGKGPLEELILQSMGTGISHFGTAKFAISKITKDKTLNNEINEFSQKLSTFTKSQLNPIKHLMNVAYGIEFRNQQQPIINRFIEDNPDFNDIFTLDSSLDVDAKRAYIQQFESMNQKYKDIFSVDSIGNIQIAEYLPSQILDQNLQKSLAHIREILEVSNKFPKYSLEDEVQESIGQEIEIFEKFKRGEITLEVLLSELYSSAIRLYKELVNSNIDMIDSIKENKNS